MFQKIFSFSLKKSTKTVQKNFFILKQASFFFREKPKKKTENILRDIFSFFFWKNVSGTNFHKKEIISETFFRKKAFSFFLKKNRNVYRFSQQKFPKIYSKRSEQNWKLFQKKEPPEKTFKFSKKNEFELENSNSKIRIWIFESEFNFLEDFFNIFREVSSGKVFRSSDLSAESIFGNFCREDFRKKIV